jgi:uncharacterized protein (DUF1697 family)
VVVTGQQRWVGLVRNVMLGREGLHRDVLLDLVADSGLSQVHTYLTTGNVTFAAHADVVAAAVARLEASLAAVIGRHEMVAVRSRTWLRALIARDPFRGYDAESWHQEVAFLSASAPPVGAVSVEGTGSTVVVELGQRELLTARPAKGPRGPHANPLLERVSGARATSRSWTTLVRLAEDLHSE